MRASRSADRPTDSGATEGKPCAHDPTAVNKAMPNTRPNAMRFALIGSSFAIENAYRLNEPIGLPSCSSGTEERQRSNLFLSLLPLRPPVQKSQVPMSLWRWHPASGRYVESSGFDHRVGSPAVSTVFPVVTHALCSGSGERRDEHRIEKLVILRTHPQLTGVAGDTHALERLGDSKGFDGLRLIRCRDQHAQHVPELLETPVVAGFFLEVVGESRAARIRRVTDPRYQDLQIAFTGAADGRRQPFQRSSEHKILDVQSGLPAGPDQEREVASPVTGDYSVRAGSFHLGHIRGEVLDLCKRVKIVADDGNVRTPNDDCLPCNAADGLTPGVVLIDEVNLSDRGLFAQILRQRIDPHAGMCVETEMPELTFRVGHFGIEPAVVEKQDRLVRIADIVLGDAIAQCEPYARPQPLGHEADVPADRGLHLIQTCL